MIAVQVGLSRACRTNIQETAGACHQLFHRLNLVSNALDLPSRCFHSCLPPTSRPGMLLSNKATSSTGRIIRGIVFDMDGTCTNACIDFAEMRRRAGIMTGDVLDVLNSWPAEKRQQALMAIEEVENEALAHMQLMPGLTDLCSWLDEQRIPRGLITRNSQASVDFFHANHFSSQPFLPALCRDFKPYKPSPAALLHICQQWQISPTECMMIGDSAKDDVISGTRASAVTVLVDTEGVYSNAQELQGELKPSYIVQSLAQLKTLLQTELELVSPQHSKPLT